jgi:hypothetical protein
LEATLAWAVGTGKEERSLIHRRWLKDKKLLEAGYSPSRFNRAVEEKIDDVDTARAAVLNQLCYIVNLRSIFVFLAHVSFIPNQLFFARI